MKQFYAALSSHKEFKHQLWVMLAFSIGLRREEIFDLKCQDIDFDKQTITIARAAVYVAGKGIIEKDTKTDNSFRKVSLPLNVVEMLRTWQSEVNATAKRRAKRNNIVLLDGSESEVSPDKWLFPQMGGTVGHPYAFNNFQFAPYRTSRLPAFKR